MSKILKALARSSLLVAHRGIAGGYNLARASEEISAAEIIASVEGPLALTECGTSAPCLCDLEPRVNRKRYRRGPGNRKLRVPVRIRHGPEADTAPREINEDVIQLISAKKNEPNWLLDWPLPPYQACGPITKRSAVWKCGPADKAGFNAGDHAPAIDGASVRDSSQVRRLVSIVGVDRKVTLRVVRHDKALNLPVRLERLPGKKTVEPAEDPDDEEA